MSLRYSHLSRGAGGEASVNCFGVGGESPTSDHLRSVSSPSSSSPFCCTSSDPSSSLSSSHHQGTSSPTEAREDMTDTSGVGLPPDCFTRYSCEELANQLTLLDLSVFRRICPEELSSCCWNKRNKLEVAPNVVAFIRRFNHVSFWTMEEILKRETAKQRADVLAHFIRLAKRLNDLNNLHSEFAILSGCQSAPVFRLHKTWNALPRRERQLFERLTELFMESENFVRLREHTNAAALKHQPCVPYLGPYLTDLVYVDTAHPHAGGGLEPPARRIKMNNILRIVSELQLSTYPQLEASHECQRYLRSVRYIDELQKFLEDDQWKRSLALEPDDVVVSAAAGSTSLSRANHPKENAQKRDPNLMAELNLSPVKGSSGCSGQSPRHKFVPGHRKSRSDGASIFLACGRFGSTETVVTPSSTSRHRLHLLDDSLLDSPPPQSTSHLRDERASNLRSVTWSHPKPGLGKSIVNFGYTQGATDATKTAKTGVDGNRQHGGPSINKSYNNCPEMKCSFQSMIKRKALIKDGRRLAMSSWQRYWLEQWGSSLVFYSPKKTIVSKGYERKDFKSDPCKCQSVVGWLVMMTSTTSDEFDECCFQLTDPVRRNVYKFRATTPDIAKVWVHSLSEGIRTQPYAVLNTNLISFE